MLAVLQYVTSGFWVFLGCLLLTVVVLQGTAAIILALRGR